MKSTQAALNSNDLLCAACQEKIAARFRDFPKPSHESMQAREVRWYRQFGKYPERISRTASGAEYIIGDLSWNKHHRGKGEAVEALMRCAKLYKRL